MQSIRETVLKVMKKYQLSESASAALVLDITQKYLHIFFEKEQAQQFKAQRFFQGKIYLNAQNLQNSSLIQEFILRKQELLMEIQDYFDKHHPDFSIKIQDIKINWIPS